MQWIFTYFDALYDLVLEMAPYLLLGFILAGIMKVFLPANFVGRYMGKENKWSVVNASLIGIPLPLCSCGVIPTGISFYKNGAGKGASVSFLVSTPQTGFDSILVTYSLLGLPFALLRSVIAFFTGIFSGYVTGFFTRSEKVKVEPVKTEVLHVEKGNKWRRMIHYALDEFLMDIAKWLIIGLLIAALITVIIPDNFFQEYLSNTWLSMLVILLASMPLYICATSSVPIAAALMLKGLSPGAALVFLMAGPATNAATMTVIRQTMGTKTMLLYIATITFGALFFGYIIDTFLPQSWFILPIHAAHAHEHLLPNWLTIGSAVILTGAMLRGYLMPLYRTVKRKIKQNNMEKQVIKVEGMGCKSCSSKIESNLRSLEFVSFVTADHETGDVVVEGNNINVSKVKNIISELGYKTV